MPSVQDLVGQLADAGVEPGGVLLVHTAYSKVKPVDGGPDGLIDALLAAVGPEGTLVMPSMSDDDDEPFDMTATPCRSMGVVADTFWRRPGVARSDSPHAFAAIGPEAASILAPHPVDVPHGLDSPVGRVYERQGRVLLLGVNHDANTTIHLAENLAGVQYRQTKHLTVTRNGLPEVIEYREIDHCCERFALVDGWLDDAGFQRKGVVGRGETRLARSVDIVEVVIARLKLDETLFLHPGGVDAECDAARASLS